MHTQAELLRPAIGTLLVLAACACGGGSAPESTAGDPPQLASANAETPVAESNKSAVVNEHDEFPPGSLDTVVISRDYDREALAAFQELYGEVLTRCDDGWTYWRDGNAVFMTGGTILPTYEVSGAYHPPQVLSEADRANGRDPQSVEWSGEAKVRFGLTRVMPADARAMSFNVGPWRDQYIDAYTISLRHGEWRIRGKLGHLDVSPHIAPFDCSELPALRARFERVYPDKSFYPAS